MKLTRAQEEMLIQVGLNTLLEREQRMTVASTEEVFGPSKGTLAARRAWETRRANKAAREADHVVPPS